MSSSPLDFLLEARLSPLDGYLTPTTQSIVVEIIFWVVFYLSYSASFSRFLRWGLSKTNVWHGSIRVRSGVFCANGQDDIILLTIIMVHHLNAGLMCWYGANDLNMWRHGYLLETGFEIADLLSMALSLYPYRLDNIKPDIMVANIFHHIPGIIASVTILTSGVYENEHLRTIALYLLVGAAVSCLVGVICHSLDTKEQLPQTTAAFMIGVAFFLYCRFYIFPMESYYLIRDIQADPELSESTVAKFLYFFGVCMTVFNCGIMADCIPKCIRYVKRNIDGVTPLDTDVVPLSREDRLKGRRRSSVFRAFEVVNETTRRRRSSFATVMGMNAIEDMNRLEQEAEEHEGNMLLEPQDLHSLHKTMQILQNRGNGDKKVD